MSVIFCYFARMYIASHVSRIRDICSNYQKGAFVWQLFSANADHILGLCLESIFTKFYWIQFYGSSKKMIDTSLGEGWTSEIFRCYLSLVGKGKMPRLKKKQRDLINTGDTIVVTPVQPLNQWLCARLRQPQCLSNGGTTVMHWVIEINFGIDREVFNPSFSLLLSGSNSPTLRCG